jgi:hypothetical protein
MSLVKANEGIATFDTTTATPDSFFQGQFQSDTIVRDPLVSGFAFIKWLHVPDWVEKEYAGFQALTEKNLRAFTGINESQAREALTDCIMPWVLRLEQEADEKLFRRSHKAMGAYSKMNTNALLRSDAAGRAQLYKALHAVGAISPDEIAELEDLPKIGAERGGNLRVIPMNMQTLEAAMAAAKSTAKRK